ncbi:hypothetical protein B0H13DRAFT_1025330 [Mycena leptocephala]|nr:hypothetical protein B0H13DRAFT_1025330 [Mycena leptocephala]
MEREKGDPSTRGVPTSLPLRSSAPSASSSQDYTLRYLLARIFERVRPGTRGHHFLARSCDSSSGDVDVDALDEPEVDVPLSFLSFVLVLRLPPHAQRTRTPPTPATHSTPSARAHGLEEDADSVARIAGSPSFPPPFPLASLPHRRKTRRRPHPDASHALTRLRVLLVLLPMLLTPLPNRPRPLERLPHPPALPRGVDAERGICGRSLVFAPPSFILLLLPRRGSIHDVKIRLGLAFSFAAPHSPPPRVPASLVKIIPAAWAENIPQQAASTPSAGPPCAACLFVFLLLAALLAC